MCNSHKDITTSVLSVPAKKTPSEQTTIEQRALRPAWYRNNLGIYNEVLGKIGEWNKRFK